jgi:GTPase SAR1 family protein
MNDAILPPNNGVLPPPPQITDSDVIRHIDAKTPHIAIWGTTQSGKTVYLSMLHKVLLDEYEKKCREGNVADAYVLSAQIETLEWLRAISWQALELGIFPPATTVGLHQFLPFVLKDCNDREVLRITFIDGPGEMFGNWENYKRTVNVPFDLMEYLRKCSGVLCLFDPTRAQNQNADTIAIRQTLLQIAGNNQRVTIPFALCMTKCDDLNCRNDGAFDDTDRFARTRFQPLIPWFAAHAQSYQWFACSAIGFGDTEDGVMTQNLIRRWNGVIGIRNPRMIQPRGISDPFLWLIKQVLPKQSGAS